MIIDCSHVGHVNYSFQFFEANAQYITFTFKVMLKYFIPLILERNLFVV